MRRDLRTSNKAVLGRYLTQINWPLLFTPLVSCEEKWQVFQHVIHSGLDTIMPVKPVKISTADVPWMNESLKSLIMKRQKAFCAYDPDSGSSTKSTGCPQSKEGLRTGQNTQLAAERILRPGGLSHHGNPECLLR